MGNKHSRNLPQNGATTSNLVYAWRVKWNVFGCVHQAVSLLAMASRQCLIVHTILISYGWKAQYTCTVMFLVYSAIVQILSMYASHGVTEPHWVV